MRLTEPDVRPWTAEHLEHAVKAAGVALWSGNVDTDALSMDERGFALWRRASSEHCGP
jgi:hypothetical protein